MVSNKKLSLIFSLVSLLFISAPAFSKPLADEQPPKVLTSIKPVQLIALAVTEGITKPDVLLPPGASPHNHSLRPSDARLLQNADVMFWIGPDMEVFLEKMLANAKNTRSVPLMSAEGIHIRRYDDEGHDHDHDHDHHHDHHAHGEGCGCQHGEHDAHIWLSPENAIAMATAISSTLSEMDPVNAEQYSHNLKNFISKMNKVDERNRLKMAAVSKRPIFVFHDAYGYLQEHYQFNIAGHFTLNPEQQPGPRHLAELREKLLKSGKTCVFREPQFEPAYIDKIVHGLDVKVSLLDPLAMDIPEGPDAYPEFINGLVDNIVDCLEQ
ncbi:zinc ABC transporter substrate-binding protein ZnuA [Endozoicomonas euniceicola]|uniref:High-affinity zinc uptake system protein ZnuA n=1 Tax=Endozoicomonas euniceicola TaxID=1234143 RepID=A0ABY6GZS5_9GAMM|nr:zinc ABC transporter substrate-binding protein ZnuA [Endozoicomonas euniceicola]UYM18299.1 zinc ABC transporter substrate-binding protein ZnuA [Endozoicomonas euniceicola]